MKQLRLFALLAFIPLAASAQEIVTAEQYFNQVSERYGQVEDYACSISVGTGKKSMKGELIFKSPSFLRIDFRDPADQVIAYDGQTLTVYIPELRAVLSQTASEKPASAPSGGAAGGASLASREGLKMMKRSYTVAYETSPAPEPLEAGSQETAVVLVLNRRTVAEGYKTIKLYVSPETKLIRRIRGWTLAGDEIVFDFLGIKTNLGIPASRFVYDSPASANVYNNFLFKSDNP
ncbi:MAG TPA: outer-membrane lipoprotein carrier protein LolA [Spirochaetales bacterium]|nr:outer-membrane lipoprotein carrier protein LolA [Spirochaetales bacterium]HRY55873.1 outer-membrane lipoprotein carrier protein LolA [Spirochaetia bacterium]HRZ65317.1 outer-membrane lipoprotein carrier protein LolA [Spirochaetia bacterium]